ncbi:MAG: lytic transglycosylase domain-containing protein [Desulfurococcales archaeon]|nr:lytic transglycosylase domain-containing protein [Desulfurococcales archaeon]
MSMLLNLLIASYLLFSGGAQKMDYYRYAATVAKQNGINEDLYLALIYVESSWNSRASNRHCYGLSQMKPSTASEIAGKKITGRYLKNNPYESLKLGARYLAKLLAINHGNVKLAITSYYYGPYYYANEDNHYFEKVLRAAVIIYEYDGVYLYTKNSLWAFL